MAKYLFLFTIGPVQSFIEQARKTQDLYAGSFLLSLLAKEGMNKTEESGGKIVFPNKISESVPNRFLAEFEFEEQTIDEKLKNIGSYIDCSVKDVYFYQLQGVLKELGTSKEVIQRAEKQYKNHLNTFWLFQEVKDYNNISDSEYIKDQEDKLYRSTYKEIEKNLGAIKNFRTFKQNVELGRKCSLCGERNVLHYRKSEKDHNDKAELRNKKFLWDADIVNNIEDSILKKGEGLCSVCIAKRKFKSSGYNENFSSISDITLYDVYNKIGYDIESNPEKIESQNIIKCLDNDNVELNNAEKKYCKIIKDKKLKHTPYYAILLFDGDSMGKWMSGKEIEGSLKEFHKVFAKELADYAQTAKDIIKFPAGKTVYAGGDDFLGFINLASLFSSLKKLREIYISKDKLSKFNIGETPTFSAGIAIVHHKMPFSEALKASKKMEKKAKLIDEKKDAFGITIVKNSGEIEEFEMKWYNEANDSNIDLLLKILNQITKPYKDSKSQFSFSFVIKLVEEFDSLLDYSDIEKPVKSEIKRTVYNSCNIENKEQRENASKELSKFLIELYDSFKDKDKWQFFNVLKILMFINRHQTNIESEVE